MLIGVAAGLSLLGCKSARPTTGRAAAEPARPAATAAYPTLGSIERLDPALDKLIPPGAVIEKLAEGFQWAEGPVWMPEGYLLFSDIPTNAVYRWASGTNVSVFIRPSGYTGTQPRGGESGSNGLTRDRNGRLVLCQHGDRCVARYEGGGRFTPLAQYFRYRRFNSPNDLVFKSNGDLYFTDPPYGLEGGNKSPAKELLWNGVYRVTPQGQVTLLTDELPFPNGMAFSPDEKTLYVAVSDPRKPCIVAYTVMPDGILGPGRVFLDASELAKARPGLPDGLKVDRQGNVFATGPGGVLILSPAGKHLGTILTGEPTANCAWGNDGSVLYITANHYLLRVKTTTRGQMP